MVMTFIRRFAKTLVDYSLALVLVIVCSPLFLAAILVIKSFSKGPLLYVQERIGFQGRRFRIFKFRTMTVDTDATDSGSVTVRSDSRVFFGAGLLRRTNCPSCSTSSTVRCRWAVRVRPLTRTISG